MYPQKLYRNPGPDDVVVNSDAERASALANGYTADLPAHDEYPKMVYLHPADKTQEHKFMVVNSPMAKDEAVKNGYQLKPHIPVTSEDTSYEGSGTDRWGTGDWTKTQGEGLTSDTNLKTVPTQAEADAVAQNGAAELTERRLASEGKPGVNEAPVAPIVSVELASEGKPGVNEA